MPSCFSRLSSLLFFFALFSTAPFKADASFVSLPREECTFEEHKEKVQKHLYAELSLDAQEAIENSTPFFYQIFQNGSPLDSYCLGTYHTLPIVFLPKRVKEIIEHLYNNPQTVAVSETGLGGEEFYDEELISTLDILRKRKKEHPSIVLNIELALEEERAYQIDTFRSIYVKSETEAELKHWDSRLTEELGKYREFLEKGWINDSRFQSCLTFILQEEPECGKELIKELETLSLRAFYEFFIFASFSYNENRDRYLFGMDALITDIFSKKHKILALDSDSLRGNSDALEIAEKLENGLGTYLSWTTLISEIRRLTDMLPESSMDKEGDQSPLNNEPPTNLNDFMTPYFENYLKGLHFADSTSVRERNKAWETKMLQILQEQKSSCLFFFGAGHLSGEYGIINLLKQKGYELRRINKDGTFTVEDESLYMPKEDLPEFTK